MFKLLLNNFSEQNENFYCRLKLPISSIENLWDIFLRTRNDPINPVRPTLQVVIRGRDYINHTDAIAKHKREREILVVPNFLLNLNPLTNPS